MVLRAQNREIFNKFLSEPEKKALGVDMSSFMKRMQARLDKVRGGDDNTAETFLARHNYSAVSRSLS